MSRPDDDYAWLKPGTPIQVESLDGFHSGIVLERARGEAKILWRGGATSWIDEMDCQPQYDTAGIVRPRIEFRDAT